MSPAAQILISSFIAILAAFIPIIFRRKNKPDELLSEDIEEIIKPDGSRIKKHHKRFK